MSLVYPVLLCGGAGTRLWPVSRQSYPKQFTALAGEESLFQAAARRFAGEGFAPPVIVTGEAFRFIAAGQLSDAGLVPAAILIEPEPRNTAPAVLAAALWLAARAPGAVMLVAPSDHLMPEAATFLQAVEAALPAAEGGGIVTFGITPDRAETGFGYLEPEAGPAADGPRRLSRFIEKPPAAEAAAMAASGRHLWNAGIFLAKAESLIAAFGRHAPAMLAPARAALAGAEEDLGFTRLAAGPWAGLPRISVDHAVMEHAAGLWVMPYEGAWSDLGSWPAVWREGPHDSRGNVISAHATAIGCENTLLRAEEGGVELVGLGLSNIVAVAMPDAVLVASATEAQRVGEAVAALKARGARQAGAFPRDYRPWGWYESLAIGKRFQVKRIVVAPGKALSLQSHHHRAEHWIVVEGTARVTIGERVQLVPENQSVFIPLGERHRLENPGKLPLTLIEVQTGGYLGEDDIIRHDDPYARR